MAISKIQIYYFDNNSIPNIYTVVLFCFEEWKKNIAMYANKPSVVS